MVSVSILKYDEGAMGDALHTPAFVSWYGLLQVQARTMDAMARELEAKTGLPASWYEVLASLCGEDCAAGRRMNELAEELLISRGGATKLVARLEQAGYVERFTPVDDRRATFARLTDEGRRVVDAAHPVQLALTEQYFGRFLTAHELAELQRISAKVLEGLGAQCSWLEAVTGDPAGPAR